MGIYEWLENCTQAEPCRHKDWIFWLYPKIRVRVKVCRKCGARKEERY